MDECNTEPNKRDRMESLQLIRKAHLMHLRTKEGEDSEGATECAEEVRANDETNTNDGATDRATKDIEEGPFIEGKVEKDGEKA